MNLLLLQPDELASDGTTTLTGRRARHALEVLRAAEGQALRVGVRGGQVGQGEVLEASSEAVRLRVVLTSDPPARPGVDLLVALPRPKALKKILPAAASLGVDRLVLVNAARVEKSYFDSKVLEPTFIDELLVLGLEQGRDTRAPEVLVKDRFRPFVEDELGALFGPSRRYVAHPAPQPTAALLPAPGGERQVLAIGPEGGWVPFELALLAARGFEPLSAGPRPLRVEVAIPYLLGALSVLTRRA